MNEPVGDESVGRPAQAVFVEDVTKRYGRRVAVDKL